MIQLKDPYRVRFQADSQETQEIDAFRHFQCDSSDLSEFFYEDGLAMRHEDLLRVAMAIYTVDRLVRRQYWHRDIHLDVEVYDPSFWASAQISDALKAVVDFVSGDSWTFQFRGSRCCHCCVPSLLSEEPRDAVFCLYSGGLDSAAGLANCMNTAPNNLIIPITIRHQAGQRQLVGDHFSLMRRKFNAKIAPIMVKSALKWGQSTDSKVQEKSQRCRSFLFLSVAAIAADRAGASDVETYESGVGMINLPLRAGMIGSMATRGSHPEFLRLMSHLTSQLFDHPIRFITPFLEKTKAEMASLMKSLGLQDLAESSISCVHYPLRHHKQKQCGVCPACVFRRQALAHAGIYESKGKYQYDLFSDLHSIPLEHLIFLREFLCQAASLSEIEIDGRFPLPLEDHLLETRVVPHHLKMSSIIDLFARHRDEWLDIARQQRSNHRLWNWIVPKDEAPDERAVL